MTSKELIRTTWTNVKRLSDMSMISRSMVHPLSVGAMTCEGFGETAHYENVSPKVPTNSIISYLRYPEAMRSAAFYQAVEGRENSGNGHMKQPTVFGAYNFLRMVTAFDTEPGPIFGTVLDGHCRYPCDSGRLGSARLTRSVSTPALKDDFYLSLIEWGPGETIAVGLGENVLLVDASTGALGPLLAADPHKTKSSLSLSFKRDRRIMDSYGHLLTTRQSQDIGEDTGERGGSGDPVSMDTASNEVMSHSDDSWDVSHGAELTSQALLTAPRAKALSKTVAETDPLMDVQSLAYHPLGNHLAVGRRSGQIEVWDLNKSQVVRTLRDSHSQRVGTMSWDGNPNSSCGGSFSLLATGSRDKCIVVQDLRQRSHVIQRWELHRQEVCGVKWSSDWRVQRYGCPSVFRAQGNAGGLLASGGNDNKALIWSLGYGVPLQTFSEHNAAVKALAWSPTEAVLATGGGTNDKSLRLFDTVQGRCVQRADSEAQICNIAWSHNGERLVSSHGYTNHTVTTWRRKNLSRTTTLLGHKSRVLYMSQSPEGKRIVTGAGDRDGSVKIWDVF